MRNRVVTVAFLVVLTLGMPSLLSARVCHPKKPITCTASTLSVPAAAVPQHTVKPIAHAVKRQAPANTKQAMLCGPWVRWICAANTLG